VLDFVNTVGGLHIEPPSPAEELMDTYDDFAIWCARLGVISERQASSLRAKGRRDERGAERALERVREVRDELLYPIFRSLADGKRPPAALLERLREEERDALADARLATPAAGSGSGGRTETLEWTFPAPGDYSFRILVNGSERKRLPLLLLAPADTGGTGDGMGTKPADD